jgi:hypothetical protein
MIRGETDQPIIADVQNDFYTGAGLSTARGAEVLAIVNGLEYRVQHAIPTRPSHSAAHAHSGFDAVVAENVCRAIDTSLRIPCTTAAAVA